MVRSSPASPPRAGLVPISRRERGPEAEDTRQRVVPPVAAGVLVAGFCFDTGVIGDAAFLTDCQPLKCSRGGKSQSNRSNRRVPALNTRAGRLMSPVMRLGRAA